MYYFFDTHIHLNAEEFINNAEEIIEFNKDFFYNNIGTNAQDSIVASEQSKKYKNVFFTAGIHPLEVNSNLANDLKTIESLIAENEKIIAIGETGLDFYKLDKQKFYEIQKKSLLEHFELSRKYNKPLVLHIRNAHKEAIEILQKNKDVYGIIHSFDGEIEDLLNYLSLDKWMISISPLILRNVCKFKKIIELTPINKLLIESDGPWLIKSTYFIKFFINIISEIKNINLDEAKIKIFENSLNIFNLKSKNLSLKK